ncbi:MAG: GrpB family protein [Spirochaetes bacterium]|nr:GrpB family protein [Spirochaetota bacterium]MBU0954356.1 GrpB family protein [Spirochaetota bacterium]
MRIIINEYKSEWKTFFKNEKELLQVLLANEYVSINHIGSTSIPGLPAKPIVDISVGVGNLKDEHFYSKLLESSGYTYNTGSKFQEWILYSKKKRPQFFHLHIMPHNSTRLLDQLIFKNCVMHSKRLQESYTWLKKYYRDHDDGLFYSMNKLPFVSNVVEAFKKGFSESSGCPQADVYQYVLNNFDETNELLSRNRVL